MGLKSLTYTSLARLDLTERDLTDIHRSAMTLNALEGITGLLIFNGTHFLQIVEGAPDAVEGLLERLRDDRRHDAIEVRDEQLIEERSFEGWSMELVRVSSRYFEARDTVAQKLPAKLPEQVADRIFRMTAAISQTVELPG